MKKTMVEQRLIDANYFVNKGIRNRPIEEGGIPLGDFHQHQRILALYPTVDAVEVVRCKDCKRRNPFGECSHPMMCSDDSQAYLQVSDNDFCSYGERR